MGQSAAKHTAKYEGSTTRSKDRTSKWMEMGRVLMGSRYSLDLQVTVSSSLENGISLTNLYEQLTYILVYGRIICSTTPLGLRILWLDGTRCIWCYSTDPKPS